MLWYHAVVSLSIATDILMMARRVPIPKKVNLDQLGTNLGDKLDPLAFGDLIFQQTP